MKRIVCGNIGALFAILSRVNPEGDCPMQSHPLEVVGDPHFGWTVSNHLANETITTWVGVSFRSLTPGSFTDNGVDRSNVFRSEEGRTQFAANFSRAKSFGTSFHWPSVVEQSPLAEPEPEPEYSRWDHIV